MERIFSMRLDLSPESIVANVTDFTNDWTRSVESIETNPDSFIVIVIIVIIIINTI